MQQIKMKEEEILLLEKKLEESQNLCQELEDDVTKNLKYVSCLFYLYDFPIVYGQLVIKIFDVSFTQQELSSTLSKMKKFYIIFSHVNYFYTLKGRIPGARERNMRRLFRDSRSGDAT